VNDQQMHRRMLDIISRKKMYLKLAMGYQYTSKWLKLKIVGMQLRVWTIRLSLPSPMGLWNDTTTLVEHLAILCYVINTVTVWSRASTPKYLFLIEIKTHFLKGN
jgi:hypothetical protein